MSMHRSVPPVVRPWLPGISRRNKVFWIYENAQENRKYGLNDWLDPELVLLPRLMKQAGYVTGHYGKWHLGDVQSSPALEQYGIDDGRCWCGPRQPPGDMTPSTKKRWISSADIRMFPSL